MVSLNGTDLLNGTENFKCIVNGLKSRFFTLSEFPFLNRELLPQGVLLDAMEIDWQQLRNYAIGLKGKQLEGLLLDLRDASSLEEIQRAIHILTIRISPRLMKLLTILFQFNDTSLGLNMVLGEISNRIKEKNDPSSEELFIWRFGNIEDKIGALSAAIEESGQDIKQCLQEYSIHEQSPFAEEGALAYLSSASKNGFQINRSWIVHTIEKQPAYRLEKLFGNYLSSFEISEYNDGINLAILQKIGQPGLSLDWEIYPLELRDKFTQWYYLHRLRLHSMGNPKKYTILAKYVSQVRDSYEKKEENLLVIDFGEIVIADICDRPYSFFYDKEVFKQEMDAWKKNEEDIPTFIRIDKKNLTARDYIIEEVEEPCIKLSYEGVDVLYIQEMLDIKMGLEPDMRRKHLALMKKRYSRRSI